MKRLLCAVLSVPLAQDADRTAAVESGLRTPVAIAGEPIARMSLAERMAHHKVAGVSIAVIDKGEIAWVKGYGMARDGTPVTPETQFQAGSISKPVTAVAAMRAVEAGRLSLDGAVNRALKRWKVPAEGSITLRQLLSHSAGIGVHAFYPGYEAGKPLPTPLQILNGQPPASNPPIKAEAPPGQAFRYSGGGYQIVQQLLTDTSGSDFASLMQKQVFDPLGMKRSSFEQVVPASASPTFAVGHDRDGIQVPGGWFLHPELAAAGLWSTATDLARLGIALGAAWNGKRNGILRPETARTMLSRQVGGWGLGFQLEGQDRALRFRHGGDNPGFKAVMVVYPAGGQGAVIMTNGDRGDRLADEILFSIADAYGWPDYAPKTKKRASVTAGELARLRGVYRLDSHPDVKLVVTPGANVLSFKIVQPSGESTAELLPAGPDRYFRRDIDFELLFSAGAPAKSVTLVQDGETFTATRVE